MFSITDASDRLVIPGLVNSFIALFKDTSLVSIVALFDLLGSLRASFSDPVWATPTTAFTTAGTYVVTGHVHLTRQGGAMPRTSADLVLQTCIGSGTGLTLLQRV